MHLNFLLNFWGVHSYGKDHHESQKSNFLTLLPGFTGYARAYPMLSVDPPLLDMYDFENDIWLCNSFHGKCFNYTAFVSLIRIVQLQFYANSVH